MIRARIIGAFSLSLLLFSCAPVLNRDVIREGDREVSFTRLRQDPAAYKGRLYIFGGVIVGTKLTQEGSRLEALQVPVDRYGHFRDRGMSEGRFLAVMPADERMLDPEVFSKGRRVTLAAEFMDVRKDRIDEMEYAYPVFRIRQIHLWPRQRHYYPAYYYDPWFYPYPYFYGGPWWSYPYPYYYNGYYGGDYYSRYRGTFPGPRRPPPVVQPPASPSPRPAPEIQQAPQTAPEQGRPGPPDRMPEQRGRHFR
jgi:outer membrane lipoprotein